MKILFVFPRPKHYDSRSIRELPSGGTEKAVIFLGEALQQCGHDVEWITTSDQIGPRDADVVITQEAQFFDLYPEAKKVFWSHHFADQPITDRSAPYARCFADKIVTLSACHREDFLSTLKLDSVVIGHGVWLGEVVKAEKDPYRLIYASTPFRGLERIPKLFKAIKEKEPRATIAIASSMQTYGDTEGDRQYKPIFDELQSIPGVELLGSLNQQQLYQEYAKASIFFYPCIWPETYCLAMDEAIAHGCHVAATRLGALGDQVYFDPSRGYVTRLDYILGPDHMNGHYLDEIFSLQQLTQNKRPKDWSQIALEWEEKVLNG